MEKQYNAQEVSQRMEAIIIMFLVFGFICLMGYMQEDDRKSVIREACTQTPEMEICSTLPKEK